ncbi:IS66 family insertion sequence element accessory protein TnpA [Pantoea endophytica]|nr:hypothetical protein [Pantoea endophytica]
MTEEQRRQHYENWLSSGMNKTEYAVQHGINIKTFGNLTRAFAIKDEAVQLQESSTQIKDDTIVASLEKNNPMKLKLNSGEVLEGTPAEIAEIMRIFKLCRSPSR